MHIRARLHCLVNGKQGKGNKITQSIFTAGRQ